MSYKESIIPNEENLKTKIYYGVSETTFRLRYANHKKKKINNIKYQTDTNYQTNIGISCHRKLRTCPGIFWEHKSYNQGSKRCLLCLIEKIAIALHKNHNMLHKRSEVISKCKHRNKYMLSIYDSKD